MKSIEIPKKITSRSHNSTEGSWNATARTIRQPFEELRRDAASLAEVSELDAAEQAEGTGVFSWCFSKGVGWVRLEILTVFFGVSRRVWSFFRCFTAVSLPVCDTDPMCAGGWADV